MEECHTFSGEERATGEARRENSFFSIKYKVCSCFGRKLFNEGDKSDFEGSHGGISFKKKKKKKKESEFLFSKSQQQSKTNVG